MKIACCQFDPIWSKVEKNMKTASEMLAIYKPNDIDVLILPEMAFTGYVFKSLQEITPFLEDAETGPSVLWAKDQAVRLQCYVVVGYPQKKGRVNYNSLCCVNPEGRVVSTYQKTFLYETDENWAEEGPGFVSLKIDDTLGKVGFGICMDLNPYQFKSDFYDCEFANYHLKQNTEIIICCMSWLKSKDDDDPMSTIRYWAMRLLPLYSDTQDGRHTIFAACNRIGIERESEFAGGSCVMDISNQNITILDYMKRNTGVMIVETN
ncbi:carbon-nitrogen hydrolase [Pilaira anomala]|nr:carbon-nitrogen hydrolase [Pilaira anomala]